MVDTPFDLPQPKTPRCTQTSLLYVLQNRTYCWSKFYIEATGTYDLFCFRDIELDPTTFIQALDPYSVIYRTSENELFLHKDFRKLSSDRHTDRHTPSKLIPLCGWSKICMKQHRTQTVQMICQTKYYSSMLHALLPQTTHAWDSQQNGITPSVPNHNIHLLPAQKYPYNKINLQTF